MALEDTDKLKVRAAKFGLPLDDKSDKKAKEAARSERFKGELDTALAKPGGVGKAGGGTAPTAEEEEKRKKRAARSVSVSFLIYVLLTDVHVVKGGGFILRGNYCRK